MMMNNQGSGIEHYYPVDPSGEATGCDDGGAEGFLGMLGDRHSSGDLFDLVWQGGAGGGGGGSSSSHLPSLSPAAVAALPSDEEMAAWLYPIVRGDELVVFTGQQDDPAGDFAGHAAAENDQQAADHKREEVDDKREDKSPKTEDYKCRAEVRIYACA
ncbi:unnamed protein product [Urochloa humidicola]